MDDKASFRNRPWLNEGTTIVTNGRVGGSHIPAGLRVLDGDLKISIFPGNPDRLTGVRGSNEGFVAFGSGDRESYFRRATSDAGFFRPLRNKI
jgi:hypothetical protein